MWVFRTIVLVPRPTVLAAAPSLVLLFGFLALMGREGLFLGQPLAPLTMAVAASLASRQCFCPTFLAPRCGPRALSKRAAFGFAAVLLALMAPAAEMVQAAYSALYLAWALVVLGTVRFAPALVPQLPSIWAGQGDGSPDAMSFVAMSAVLRAVGAWLLMLAGDQMLWVFFITLGSLAIGFLTDWVILLYLYLRRVNS